MAAPKHLHPNVLDGGLTYLRTTATTLYVVINYALTDSYATATTAISGGGKAVGSLVISSANFSAIASGAGTGNAVPRYTTLTPPTTITVGAGNGTATGDTLGLILTNGSTTVLLSTDLTPDSIISVGNVLTISAFTITFNQPT